MIEFQWRGERLQQSLYRVEAGDTELCLQRCYRDPEGAVVFMLSGFGRHGAQFWPQADAAGLAPYLASAGFDVYVADWRGKGSVGKRATRASSWGVHEIINVDIPALLAQVARLRGQAPCFWVGQGLGSVLLVASLCRSRPAPATPLGMVHFGASRRVEQANRWQQLASYSWQLRMELSLRLTGTVGMRPSARESVGVYRDWCQWRDQEPWRDPHDGFNYRVAARSAQLPASLYLQPSPGPAGNTGVKLWLQELGRHDARILTLNKRNGNLHNYSDRNMLTRRDACDDHFVQIQRWLQERLAGR